MTQARALHPQHELLRSLTGTGSTGSLTEAPKSRGGTLFSSKKARAVTPNGANDGAVRDSRRYRYLLTLQFTENYLRSVEFLVYSDYGNDTRLIELINNYSMRYSRGITIAVGIDGCRTRTNHHGRRRRNR